MGVFGKKDDISQDMQKAENEAISSIIDTSMSIIGEISFKGKARIDGKIKGNVTGEHLILSKTGTIEGDLKATSFICHGSLEGNAKANIITLKKECSIIGKLEANSLTVDPGASVDGEIKAATREVKASLASTKADTAGKQAAVTSP